jgi:hypothetical protein
MVLQYQLNLQEQLLTLKFRRNLLKYIETVVVRADIPVKKGKKLLIMYYKIT